MSVEINAGVAIAIVIHNTDVTPKEREYAAECLEGLLNHVKELRAENERLKVEPTVVERRIVDRIQQIEQENERLKQSMVQHFSEEHLAGDGPEIDRWKAQNRQLEQRNAELLAENTDLKNREKARLLAKAGEQYRNSKIVKSGD